MHGRKPIMGNFNFIKTEIEGVYIIDVEVFGDKRGYFMETYNYENFKAICLDNHMRHIVHLYKSEILVLPLYALLKAC